MTHAIETPERTMLAAARAALHFANVTHASALAGMVRVATQWTSGEVGADPVSAAVRRVQAAAIERDEWRAMVDELVRAAAISVEKADPLGPTTAQRARVEALIASRVFGHTIADTGSDTARRWRIIENGAPLRPIAHYASDPVACERAVSAVKFEPVAFALLAVLGVSSEDDAHDVACLVLGSSCYERAVAVLATLGVEPDEDPCGPCP